VRVHLLGNKLFIEVLYKVFVFELQLIGELYTASMRTVCVLKILLNNYLQSPRAHMKSIKFRSNFEAKFADLLNTAGIGFSYEPTSYEYVLTHTYTPDFRIAPDIYVETKGLMDGRDRSKMLEVRKQNPHIVIILCFQNPDLKLSKSSKTSYRQWAEKHGFLWCNSDIFSLRNAFTKAHRMRISNSE
jgi:hypothetical protein